MQLQNYPLPKLKSDLLSIASKHLDLNEHQLFIFGSRATNLGDDRSDIDIGILGKNKLSPNTLYSIKEEIDDLPTLYSFDLIDFASVSPSFSQVALKNIIKLN